MHNYAVFQTPAPLSLQYASTQDFWRNMAWTNETKYLGFTLDSKLRYRTHISCILRKANYRLRQLFPTLNKSSTNDINLALVIYKSLLRSILSYASPWRGYAANTYVNKVLKITTKLPRVPPNVTLHEQKKMSLIKSHFKRLVRALYRKSATSETARFKNWDTTIPSVINICVPCPCLQDHPLHTATLSNT
jgi:hypothetical protein